jgi:hypothetical protein
MPYGVAKKLGGDSAKNDAYMERCVAAVQKQGHSKVSAIRICKAGMRRKRSKGK